MLPAKSPYTQQRGMEFHAWTALCLALGVERYVEIGTNRGGSANFVRSAGIKQVVTLDVNAYTTQPLSRPPLLRSDCVYILGDSHAADTKDKVLESFNGLYPQAVFIDGDHEGTAPRLDFELWWPITTTVLGFHDILEMPAVKSVWDQYKTLYKSLVIAAQEQFDQKETIPGNDNWGGIGVLFR